MWTIWLISYVPTFTNTITVCVETHPPLHLHPLPPETNLTHIVIEPVQHQVVSAVRTKLKGKDTRNMKTKVFTWHNWTVLCWTRFDKQMCLHDISKHPFKKDLQCFLRVLRITLFAAFLIPTTTNISLWPPLPSVLSFVGWLGGSSWSLPLGSLRCSVSPVCLALFAGRSCRNRSFQIQLTVSLNKLLKINIISESFFRWTDEVHKESLNRYSLQGNRRYKGWQLGGAPALHQHHGLFHLHLVIEGDELRLCGTITWDQPLLHVGLVKAVQPEHSRKING